MANHDKPCSKDVAVCQMVELQADVTIKPHVTPLCGGKMYFIDAPDCEGNPCDCCTSKSCITIRKVLCIEIPLRFDVDVDVEDGVSKCCPVQVRDAET